MRLIALLLLVTPGLVAVYGIKLIRDALFGEFHDLYFHIAVQGLAGVLFFAGGLAFIGGFILHRDRKRNLTKGRFKQTNYPE
ncbi:DUF2627 family protein [Halobacillus litoralis]|uniref:DUF2627 family protein n=1 Tax=Halobacillus litoralis TaxID=45668 RepID=A0A845E1Y9_9BACI|nr:MULTISPECIES: DUF2627 domain-containing protein [Halobacillus]MYL19714.1 DUF2627 family protein [Halobacillus litoralis]MYL28860.1 DUF2627 family protein [Halobacillus halophilus]MYL37111.1 DUF2627 family protein [Halobacillus litoralis]